MLHIILEKISQQTRDLAAGDKRLIYGFQFDDRHCILKDVYNPNKTTYYLKTYVNFDTIFKDL